MRITSVVALFADLPEAELTNWVARGWVQPDRGDAAQGGSDQDEPDRGGPDRGGPDQGAPDQDDLEQGGRGWDFREIDVARVRLIHDLHHAMAIDEATMPLVLSLLDQVYALRGTLRDLLGALGAQSEDVRAAVSAAVRRGPQIQ
jgi:chaperone modulatory protein CbpM